MTPIAAAVLAAYGPAERTRGAVAALRAQLPSGTPVVVYPGNRAGRQAAASQARTSGVQAVHDAGADGLRVALTACPEGPVLLAHDDIVPGPDMAVHLAAAYVPGRFVVPYVNAPGTRHDHGSADVAAALRQPHVRGDASGLSSIRPVVVLADRDMLLEHGVPRHIGAPGVQLGTMSLDFVAAANAVAFHTGDCRRRLVETADLDGRPLLIATLIVRDEEHMLPDCLASLQGVVDEILVCDTGSVDRTVEIARESGARVVHRQWRNDFAWARNEAIEEAGNPWYVLVVDADERLQCANPEGLRRLLAQSVDEHSVFEVEVANASLGRDVDMTFLGVRVFRPDHLRYVGALHEQPQLIEGLHSQHRSLLHGVRVLHLGYDDTVRASRDKGERNLAIARDSYERERSPERALHYARALSGAQRDPQLQRELVEFVLASGVSPALTSYALSLLAEHDLNDGDVEMALARAGQAVEFTPADDVAALLFARAAFTVERLDLLAEKARWRRGRPSPRPAHSSPAVTARALSREAVARAATGDLDGAIEDARLALASHAPSFTAWVELAEALLDARPAQAEDVLTDLALLSAGGVVRHLASTLHPAATARLAARLAAAGHAAPDDIEIGLIAAILQRLPDPAMALARRAAMLEPTTIESLAERAAPTLPQIAGVLRTALPAAAMDHAAVHTALPRPVLFLEQDDADARVDAAVDACAAVLAAEGYQPVRHRTRLDSPFSRAMLPDGSRLPLAEAAGLIEVLRPELVVFASMPRLAADAGAVEAYPATRRLLLVPASPLAAGGYLDAVIHPDDPDVAARALALLTAPSGRASTARPPVIPTRQVVAGRTSVVVAGADAEQLDACIDAITQHTEGPFEIVLVAPDSVAALAGRPHVRHVSHDTGAGVAARNAGIAAASGEWVCILSPDVRVTPGWLEGLRRALTEHGATIAAPRLHRADRVWYMPQAIMAPEGADLGEWAAAWAAGHADRSWPAGRLADGCLLARRALFEQLGGLDETAPDDRAATAELCRRTRAQGGRLRVADGAVVVRESTGDRDSIAALAPHRGGPVVVADGAAAPVPVAAIVLCDSEAAPARRSVQSALAIADRVLVLERGDVLATELAVAGIAPDAVETHACDWQTDEGLPKLVADIGCRTVLILGAGEVLDMTSFEAAREELEHMPLGPVRVRVGERDEVRIHPPVPEAIDRIGGCEGPLVEALAIRPAS